MQKSDIIRITAHYCHFKISNSNSAQLPLPLPSRITIENKYRNRIATRHAQINH